MLRNAFSCPTSSCLKYLISLKHQLPTSLLAWPLGKMSARVKNIWRILVLYSCTEVIHLYIFPSSLLRLNVLPYLNAQVLLDHRCNFIGITTNKSSTDFICSFHKRIFTKDFNKACYWSLVNTNSLFTSTNSYLICTIPK